ncbi:alpha-L-rhamnosidase [Brevibacterium oceani]|uniref:alpha-L-rhamnosidase n=1 Tax=Brevibacterium oceani TaxID=358099 RepID=UPI001B343CDC|nr:alpha-L-rhamnosidase [Brevibacterium oceani]
MSGRHCRDLRVEYQHAPKAVATKRPRFSWIADHVQEHYRVRVFRGQQTMWDSGLVGSADTAFIEYDGVPLVADADYRWSVLSRGPAGEMFAESTFSTALLDASEWTAQWVEPKQEPTAIERWSLFDWIAGRVPESGPEGRLQPVQLLRQALHMDEAPVRARLYSSARGVYTPTINGHVCDDQVLAPGYDSYEHRISMQCADVTALLRPGENVIGLALADGWFAGRFGISGSSAQFGDRTSATWQLHLESAEGERQIITSGDDVVSRPGPWLYSDLSIGECFDARALPAGWDRPGFDASDWNPVRTAPVEPNLLVPFAGEPIRRVAELRPVGLERSGSSWVVDFGQNIAGRVRLRMRGLTPGHRVMIEHTETLDADGEWFQNIEGANKDQTDVYVSAGGDGETFEPSFTFHGFRYARITGIAEVIADDVVGVVISSDLEQTGEFACSDTRLTRLHDNVVWSQRANFLSVPTDCPQREKIGWTGDIQVFASAATNNANVVPFLSRWLENLRADQLPTGEVPITSPRSPFDIEAAAQAQGLGAIVSASGWSDAIAFVPWAVYERSGDTRILEENYAAMLDWIEFQRRTAAAELPTSIDEREISPVRRARQSLLFNTGDHFGDWLAPSTLRTGPLHEAILVAPRMTSEFVAPMFQAQTLTIAGRAAAVLGRSEDVYRLAAQAAAVREAFAAEYLDPQGHLPHELQGLYVLALAFDMVPAEKRLYTAAHLADLVEDNGYRLDTGFLSVPYLLDVLWETGYPEIARRLLNQSQVPSWLYEVDRGATTIWESWDAVAPDGTPRHQSLNHYAFGCVDDWLYRRVAGIRATSPGFRTATIDPDFESGLEWARAHVSTPWGRLGVEWTKAGDTAQVSVTAPHGTEVALATPDGLITVPPGRSSHTFPVSFPIATPTS